MNEDTRLEDIQREISELMNKLSANSSDIGDWKINKIYEYRLQEKPDPYDLQSLLDERQAVRDRINELQDEAAEIEASPRTATDEAEEALNYVDAEAVTA
jgi:predicted  nucleic acid-binding Zn-ribbon protein